MAKSVICPFKWRLRYDWTTHERHSCQRTDGHSGNHVCECGAQF